MLLVDVKWSNLPVESVLGPVLFCEDLPVPEEFLAVEKGRCQS